MARIRQIARPWTQQPQEAMCVDPSVWPGRSQVVLPSMPSPEWTGANANDPFSRVGPAGRMVGWRPNSSTVPGEFYTWSAGDFNVGSDASVIALLSPTEINTLECSVEYGGANWGLVLGINVNGTSAYAFYVDSPTTNEYGTTLSGLTASSLYPVGLVKRGASVSVFCGGMKASSSGGNGGIRRSAGSGLGYQSARSNYSYGSAALVAITSEALSDEQMFALLSNVQAPWQIFEPQRIVVPTYSAPAGVPDITGVVAENILATSAGYRVTLNYA